jgi:hypothetical protein
MVMAFGETPSFAETNIASPQAVVDRLLPTFETVETQEQAVDAVLELKLQCAECGADFTEAQTILTAGMGSTAKSVASGIIRGVLTNPQGLTAFGQLLS